MDTLENDLVNNNFRKVEEWADKVGVKMLKQYELTYSEFEDLSKYAKSQGLLFFSTPVLLNSIKSSLCLSNGLCNK